jgi:hypothetical protein
MPVTLDGLGELMVDGTLIAFWVSFPKDPSFPLGFGVTAWSRSDALRLLEAQGYDFHLRASEIVFRDGITIDDVEHNHVRPNMGPMIFRGVWFPCLNIGFGAP